MKYLIIILLGLLILNAFVLWLLLVGALIKGFGQRFSIKENVSDREKAWEPPLTTPEHRRSGATGSFQES